MLTPKLPDFDLETFPTRPFHERLRLLCGSWAADGYGSPMLINLAYGLKIVAYVWVWGLFCSVEPGWSWSNVHTWWAEPVAFQKMLLWTMLFEGLGWGCGSGPLTGRYVPPVGGATYWLRPGTIKLPLLNGLGTRRTLFDVLLYASVLGLLMRALLATEVTAAHILPIVLLMPVLGLLDKTLFLAFRSEHYVSSLICVLAGADWIAGNKLVWMAIWWWAATSKLNAHFPSVICVMTSNAPWTRWGPLRRWVYRDYPNDLRPSGLAQVLTHFGTAVEYLAPLMLLVSAGGPLTVGGLLMITGLHLFILSQVPMGVPLEWNVVMIYGAWLLFGVHADVSAFSLGTWWVWVWLVGFHIALPLYGSLVPRKVSFLLSMRYYAGNWPYSVWLFKDGAEHKLARLTRSAPLLDDQLGLFYDKPVINAVLSKVIAFRLMHLQGRVLRRVLPRIPDVGERRWFDGELVAGLALGWNFGDGHLHQEQLLEAIQPICKFEPGEVRCIFVESQPTHDPRMHWRLYDAHDGRLDSGYVDVDTLLEGQPWELEATPDAS